MSNIEQALERIRRLECPTGDVEQRVARILQEYGIGNEHDFSVSRDEQFGERGPQMYRVSFSNGEKSIIISAVSGMDDYVAQVKDVHME